ncbi:type II toxin-antitoxin system antitoxin DNA ADP-ribosyl glycohydrolase DarG [Mucilaginibacter ginsenosidivorans]|uniref:Macro domain-containing protein n=1 Tax=Mucilaginibacter ginsenosidivorans TaxID=398053 RepID=A0A5B8USA9_9SPHI|nr:macro domain-containing protein [Mucilaginibacter ginsenosidivorans]QEC61987.1 macro domain-containing protein [Mucilaginibacter ginsenosidivorans]
MIQTLTGDLFKSDAQALVNTVNTVGVMGKGIALQFKEAFPHNNRVYIDACKRKELEPGKLLSVWDEHLLYGKKLIVNFPTKTHWRQPSKYEYIEKGLVALREEIKNKDIKSIAIPPLGAGNGGLNWVIVKPMIVEALKDLPVDVQIFEPNAEIKELLQNREVNKNIELTPARAALLYSLFAFESFGEYSSLFAANKLAYFLQRMGQKLRLDFRAHHYGPYAVGVEKVLYHLNGTYLKGLEQGQAKPFEPLKLNYQKWEMVNDYVARMQPEDRDRLNQLLIFLKNFTSELSLEILASVDFIMSKHPFYTVNQVADAMWTRRKKELFRLESIEKAYNHLQVYKTKLLIK